MIRMDLDAYMRWRDLVLKSQHEPLLTTRAKRDSLPLARSAYPLLDFFDVHLSVTPTYTQLLAKIALQRGISKEQLIAPVRVLVHLSRPDALNRVLEPQFPGYLVTAVNEDAFRRVVALLEKSEPLTLTQICDEILTASRLSQSSKSRMLYGALKVLENLKRVYPIYKDPLSKQVYWTASAQEDVTPLLRWLKSTLPYKTLLVLSRQPTRFCWAVYCPRRSFNLIRPRVAFLD
ncbi:MAG: hypothetical protein QW343_01700 [Candidatus Norongarragalinales archaeon]